MYLFPVDGWNDVESVELLMFPFLGLLQVRRRCSILPFLGDLLLLLQDI
jgi:hypothetical protein